MLLHSKKHSNKSMFNKVFFLFFSVWLNIFSLRNTRKISVHPGRGSDALWDPTVPDAFTSVSSIISSFGAFAVWFRSSSKATHIQRGCPPAVSASSALDVHVLHLILRSPPHFAFCNTLASSLAVMSASVCEPYRFRDQSGESQRR